MSAFLTWIQVNPAAFKSFLTTFLALLIKLILQLSGKSDELEHWNDAVNQVIDLVVYAVSAYGVISGGIHVSRGASLTQADHAASIVAALQGPPTSRAVAEVQAANQDIAASHIPHA